MKSASSINRTSAIGWSKKAYACYKEAVRTGDADLVSEGNSHRDEMLEHSAIVGDEGATTKKMQRALDKKVKALGLVEGRAGFRLKTTKKVKS